MKYKSLIIIPFALLTFLLGASAQDRKFHLDAAVTGGTTGIGGEVIIHPATDWVSIRVGGAYMPHINIVRRFTIQVGENYESHYDANGNPVTTKFDKMADFMYNLTGYRTDEFVSINRRPVMNSGHVLVDVHPLKNKNWHITAGINFGGSDLITGENDLSEAPLLTNVCLYNNMYQKVQDGEGIEYDNMEIYLPTSVKEQITAYGRATVNIGTFAHDITDDQGNVIHQAGDKFFLEPDQNCEITADCRVNSIRPYLGIGYMGALTKHTNRWKIGFDAGVLFWGGHPTCTCTRTEHITTTVNGKKTTTTQYYDIDISRDIVLGDKYPSIQKEINIIKALVVYPVLEFKLSYNIF